MCQANEKAVSYSLLLFLAAVSVRLFSSLHRYEDLKQGLPEHPLMCWRLWSKL